MADEAQNGFELPVVPGGASMPPGAGPSADAPGEPPSGGAMPGNGTGGPGRDETRPYELVDAFEMLISRFEEMHDPQAREIAEEMIGSIIELYGEGLARVFDKLGEAGEAGERLVEELSSDGVVASLMLIHDLFPVELSQRVADALDSVRPYMESHGGNVELLGITDGVARIRLEGNCKGCAASSATLELAIKQALEDAAPDLEGLEVEGAVEAPAPAEGALELPMVQADSSGATASPNGSAGAVWLALEGAASLGEGEAAGLDVAGRTLLVARVGTALLAYSERCAGCGSSLVGGEPDAAGVLACPECERRFELRSAGRCSDDPDLQLEPVPLLGEAEGEVRVAVPG